MNKEYIYIDEKAIIRNNNGEKEPIKYYNGLDKVLEQENLIETMKNKITNLEHKKNNTRIRSAVFSLIPVLLGFITPIISVPLLSMCGVITTPYTSITDTIFGPMMYGPFLSATISIPTGIMFGLPMTIISFLQRTQDKKHLMGLENELNYLNKRLNVEKEKSERFEEEFPCWKRWQEFNKSKNFEHENKNFRIVKINNEAIKNLNSKLELCYDCGYNGKKYYKYYKKHKQLPKEFIEMFKKGEIEIIKNFLEETGPQLVKRR